MSVAESQGPAPARVQVRVLNTEADFAALEADWERLQGRDAQTSVFESFDWLHLWWNFYGRGQPLSVLIASAGQELVGVLAVYVQTVKILHVPVRLLRFVGTGGDTAPDDLGPVLARGREGETARVLADALLAIPGWDVLLLTDMNPDCAFTAAVAGATRAARLKTLSGRSERIVYIDLPPTWEAWLETQSSHKRKRIRYIRKKFGNTHQARFFVWADPATLDEGFDRLAYLHRKRWQGTGQQHGFSSAEYSGFHRAVMKACMARGRLRLYCLELDGQIAAMQYCYKFGNGVYVMQTGFDTQYSDAGQALLWHITEHAIGEGHKVLDFLRGDHSYKDQAGTGERHTEFVTAFRNTLGAWAYRTRRLYLPAAKAQFLRLKRRLRPADAQAT